MKKLVVANGLILCGKQVGIGDSMMAKVVLSKKKNLIWNLQGNIRNNSPFSII